MRLVLFAALLWRLCGSTCVRLQSSSNFVPWIPNNIKTSVCAIHTLNLQKAATSIGNSTCIESVFSRVANQYHELFKRKAFLHWYTGEGMDEMQFHQAECDMHDMIAEYQQYQESVECCEEADEEQPEDDCVDVSD